MQAPTPWRRMLYERFKHLELQGEILDLGGSRKSGYHELFLGSKKITVVNLDQEYGFDLRFDLEKAFPLKEGSFETILCINTLEHIFNFKQLLNESFRVLVPKGKIILAVPFLMNIHPSPHDFWRYSKETLERILKESGFTSVQVKTIGTGPCTASLQLLYPFLRFSMVRNIAYLFARLFDYVISFFSYNLKERYPLGYLIVAKKYE